MQRKEDSLQLVAVQIFSMNLHDFQDHDFIITGHTIS